MKDIEQTVKNLLPEKSAIKPNMQEPFIQKILKLATCTFARKPSTRSPGRRKRVLEGEAFANQLAEISSLMRQVRFIISLFLNRF